MRPFALVLFLLLFFSGCSGLPVQSTVDAYGEGATSSSTPLCFIRESLPLRDRPIADACREAARDHGVPTAEPGATGCIYVVAQPKVAGASQKVDITPRYDASLELLRHRGRGYGYGYGGLGMSSSTTEVESLAEREISLSLYQDQALKTPLRTIDVRSSGAENSVSAVSYEMCEAAFQEYPRNLRGQVYSIKRHKQP